MLFFIFFTLKIHTVSVCLFTEEQYACTYGEGKVNFEALLKTLKELGYDGAITIERECAGDKAKEDILAGKKLLDSIIENL